MKDYIRKINYYETDKMGITHHSNYIRFMEEARIDFLDQIGCGYAKMERDGEDYKNQTVFIGHADAIGKAQELQKRVAPMVKDTVICDIGPVIGTHVGSGMVALLFLGKRDITM